MDLNRAASLLYEYYRENDVFSYPQDYKRLDWNSIVETDGEKVPEHECKIAVQAALDEMVSDNFIKKIPSGSGKNKSIDYLIVNSLKGGGTELILSNQTVKNLKILVASLLPMMDLQNDYDPNGKDITEEEVVLILEAIAIISSQLTEKLKEIEEKDKIISELKKNQKPPEDK